MINTQTNVYDSSTVEASTYNYKTKDLIVTFKHGTYVYRGVSEVDYLEFSNDKSQGIALNRVIKGVYEYEKIED